MKVIRKIRKKANSLNLMLKFHLYNLTSQAPADLADKSDLHISLTSYGNRIKTVHLTIESIFQQSLSFASITLYLSRQDIQEKSLPNSLLRLQRRGLLIKFSDENIKSYKKLYYSYLLHQNNADALLISADDDVFYPTNWLENLCDKYQQVNGVVCCRGKKISVDDNCNVLPYKQWNSPNRHNIENSVLLMPTGIAGVMYPIAALQGLAGHKDDFLMLAPYADDIWFKGVTLANGFGSYLANDKGCEFPAILSLSTKKRGLTLINVHQGGNDQQMGKTWQWFGHDFSKFVMNER